MKKSQLRNLIREVVEERLLVNEINRVHEEVSASFVEKTISSILTPLVKLAAKANPNLQQEFLEKYKSPEEIAQALASPEIESQAKKIASGFSSKLDEAARKNPKRKKSDSAMTIFDHAKQVLKDYVNVGTFLALVSAVAWVVTREYIDGIKPSAWHKMFSFFGGNLQETYKFLADVIWGALGLGSAAYGVAKANFKEAKSSQLDDMIKALEKNPELVDAAARKFNKNIVEQDMDRRSFLRTLGSALLTAGIAASAVSTAQGKVVNDILGKLENSTGGNAKKKEMMTKMRENLESKGTDLAKSIIKKYNEDKRKAKTGTGDYYADDRYRHLVGSAEGDDTGVNLFIYALKEVIGMFGDREFKTLDLNEFKKAIEMAKSSMERKSDGNAIMLLDVIDLYSGIIYKTLVS